MVTCELPRRRCINPPPPYGRCVSCAQLATVIQDAGGLFPSTGITSCRAPLWNPPQSARSSKRSFPILKRCRSQKSKASCLVAAFQSTFQRVLGQVNSTRFPSLHSPEGTHTYGLHSPEGTQAFSRQPGLAVPSTIDSESSEGAQADHTSPTAPSTKTIPRPHPSGQTSHHLKNASPPKRSGYRKPQCVRKPQ